MPRSLSILILTAFLAALATAGTAQAVSDSSPVALSVSTPADSLAGEPGETVTSWIRVGNNGATALPVTISPATIELGDNGATTMSPGVDPRFVNSVTLETAAATVPANDYIEISVSISIPTSLIPDIYLLGFLVTPAPGAGSVQVINQIGAFISIELPGSRDRRIEAAFDNAPHFVLSDSPTLTVRVDNVGESALEFTSETTIDGFGTATPGNIRVEPKLLPSGTSRDVEITWVAELGIGVFDVHTRLVHNLTQSETTGVELEHKIVVVSPIVLTVMVTILLILAAGVVLLVHHRRRILQRPANRHGYRQ